MGACESNSRTLASNGQNMHAQNTIMNSLLISQDLVSVLGLSLILKGEQNKKLAMHIF